MRPFAQVRDEMDTEYPHRPATFGDGVRTVAIEDIPDDAETIADGTLVQVRVPAPHHNRPSQGWLTGYWSQP